GAVATSSGLVFTGDMRGHFLALDARTGAQLWKFQTGSGIIGSPITYELDGKQYVAVPSGGIGGDMTFYYKEPKAGNLWVFALDAKSPPADSGNDLLAREGAVPRVGPPGSTLGGRVLAGYGFPATDGGAPVKGGEPSLQPTSATPTNAVTAPSSVETASGRARGTEESIALGEQVYRARCSGCHQASGGAGKKLFPPTPPPSAVQGAVMKGRGGTTMPAFGGLLSTDEIWAVFEFLLARDKLQ